MVRAEFAGCGKSYACKAMEQRGHKVLFVCPTNKLAQNNKEHGITMHHFFGVGHQSTKNQKKSKFDASGYDVIVFDEIYFANIRMLARVKAYCEANPDKIIIATGDTAQLECIDLISNNMDYDKYMDHCIDTIFPHNIHLMINKRLKNEEDKITLAQFKKDIFDQRIPVVKTIKKYFKLVDELATTQNIAYKNSTCESVANSVREMLGKTDDFEVGEKLICRKYLKMPAKSINVNFEYVISKIYDHSITIQDESNGDEFNLLKTKIEKHFIYNYCRTCHSMQGSSIDENITIFDWNHFFVDRKWIYTAITRATDFKHVVFIKLKRMITTSGS